MLVPLQSRECCIIDSTISTPAKTKSWGAEGLYFTNSNSRNSHYGRHFHASELKLPQVPPRDAAGPERLVAAPEEQREGEPRQRESTLGPETRPRKVPYRFRCTAARGRVPKFLLRTSPLAPLLQNASLALRHFRCTYLTARISFPVVPNGRGSNFETALRSTRPSVTWREAASRRGSASSPRSGRRSGRGGTARRGRC